MTRRALAIACAAVAPLAAAYACAGEMERGQSPAPGDAGVTHQDVAPADSNDPPTSDGGEPIRWIAPAKYMTRCAFVTATSDVPPITWRTCPSSPSTTGLDCKSLEHTWTPDPSPTMGYLSQIARAEIEGDGTVTLLLGRYTDHGKFRIIGTADGPLYSAFHEDGVCAAGTATMAQGYFAWDVTEGSSEFGGGFLAGRVTDPVPTLAVDYDSADRIAHEAHASNSGILDVTRSIRRYDLSGTGQPSTLVPSLDMALEFSFAGADIFWEGGSLAELQLLHYSPTTGVGTFLTFGSDETRGVADLGTDGQAMVWLEGQGRSGLTQNPFPNISIVTSPYTSDPAALTRRVLRSDTNGSYFSASPFVVGCGYAARYGEMKSDGGPSLGTEVVRLSDGHAWLLPAAANAVWSFTRPLAITCDEIFVLVHTPTDGADIARVKLASLGAGIDP